MLLIPSLMKLLHGAIAAKKPWAAERNLDYLNNANELDFDVAGVLLLGQDQQDWKKRLEPHPKTTLLLHPVKLKQLLKSVQEVLGATL